ncbi:hypothetical protein M3S04_13900 [Xanthomonas sp. PPL139]|uniref:hypothetical protein n=1 Tax=unclassified Xanthomonas TaxID=2643310 RepID=UPI0033BA20BE
MSDHLFDQARWVIAGITDLAERQGITREIATRYDTQVARGRVDAGRAVLPQDANVAADSVCKKRSKPAASARLRHASHAARPAMRWRTDPSWSSLDHAIARDRSMVRSCTPACVRTMRVCMVCVRTGTALFRHRCNRLQSAPARVVIVVHAAHCRAVLRKHALNCVDDMVKKPSSFVGAQHIFRNSK